MKPLTLWILVAAGAALLFIVGGAAWFVQASQGPRRVGYHATTEPITQTLLATGRTAPPARVELGSMVQSTVVEVLAEEGASVEAGTLLVRLADEDAAARVREAEAAVSEAEARLGRVQGVGRRAAGQQLQRAQLLADEAEREYARNRKLFEDGAVTEASLDQSRQQRDTARSQVVSARLEAAATGQTGADTAAAAASLARAQAALEGARVALDRTHIRAPAAGVVLQRLVEPGEVVRPGDPLISFSSGGALQIRITPDEVHLGQLAVGLPAKVAVQAFPQRILDAQVAFIAPQVDPERGTVEVRLDLVKAEDLPPLRPDMTASVEVVLGASDAALVLPTRLVRDLGSNATWVLLARDGVAVRQDVELGLQGTEAVEIAAGLEAADVVLGLDANVQPGDPVRVRRVESAGQD